MNRKGFAKVGLFAILFLAFIIILGFYIIPALSDANLSSDINVTLQSPVDMYNVSSDRLNFSYTPTWGALNVTVSNCSFYQNFTGIWATETINASNLVNYTINWINFTAAVSDDAYMWNVYCYNESNDVHDYASSNKTFTIDRASPQWSVNATSIQPTYSQSAPSFFNITWTDATSGISKALIESNWSASAQNYTMDKIVGNVYGYNAVLPAGPFYWKFYVNDSAGNWNSTTMWNFTIGKATPTVTLYLNDSSSNGTSIYPNSTINVTAVSSGSGLYVQLWENIVGVETLLDNETSLSLNATRWGYLNHNFTAQIVGNANYTDSALVTYWWNVSKGTPTVTLYLDGSTTDVATSTYPNSTINVTAVSNGVGGPGLYVQLLRNGTLIDQERSISWNITQWHAWNNNFSARSIANANYTDSALVALWWNVSRGDPSSYINMYVNNTTTATETYPSTVEERGNVSTVLGADDLAFVMYYNASSLGSGNATNQTVNSIQLGNGTYVLVYNTSGGTNWTSGSSTARTLYINKGSLTGTLSTSNSTYPTNLTMTAAESNTGDSDVIYTIYCNNTLVNTSTGLAPIGTYQFGVNSSYYLCIFNTTAAAFANWNSNSSIITNTTYVNKGTPTLNVYIDGAAANKTISYPATANVSANETNSGDSDCTYTLNRNGTALLSSSNAWNVTSLGNETYMFNYSMSGTCANWILSNSQNLFLNVSKGNPTSLMNITINGTAADSPLTYPYATNANASSNITGQSSLVFNLYKNGAFASNATSAPYTTTDEKLYGASTYTYIFNTTGNANYTNGTVTRTLTISQGTPSISLTLSSSSVTVGAATTVICSVSTPTNETNITLLRNGTNVNTTENGVSYTGLTVGPWNYTCNSSASTNYSALSTSQILTVSAAATTIGGTTGGSVTSSGTVTTVKFAAGKVNITASSIITGGKMIVTVAKYQDVAIRGMNITVVNNVASIKIMASKITLLPSTVPYDIDGKVYNYINVDKLNITDADIRVVNISFAVNKTWLTNNNVSALNITLYRWANNKWNDLSAVKVSEDDREAFFTVSSPGLSIFIIGTKGGAPIITETPAACTESWTCGDWSACTNSQQTKTCTDANSCGTTADKPSESQSCTVSKGETTVAAPVQTSILTTVIVIVVAIIACVFIFLQRVKISSYLGKISKKTSNHKKTSYLESLAKKVEEEEEEKFTDI